MRFILIQGITRSMLQIGNRFGREKEITLYAVHHSKQMRGQA